MRLLQSSNHACPCGAHMLIQTRPTNPPYLKVFAFIEGSHLTREMKNVTIPLVFPSNFPLNHELPGSSLP